MPIALALIAILIWSTLALVGARLNAVPALLVLGITLSLSGLSSLFLRGAWRVPLKVLAVGVGGIFGYHFLYFRAFALAPAVEANLINYLWPLLIVALSPLILPGYALRPRHILGALLGLSGAALIVTGGKLSLQAAALPGYLLAMGAAFTWALYSLLTKRLPPFSTATVSAFCAVSGLLSLGMYALSGQGWQPVAALAPLDWLFLVLAGLGPMGAAFFFWDAALKKRRPACHRFAGLPHPAALHPQPGAHRRQAAHPAVLPGHVPDHCGSGGWELGNAEAGARSVLSFRPAPSTSSSSGKKRGSQPWRITQSHSGSAFFHPPV